jgi:PPOX class probable F420-dependent enzyme
MSGKLSEAELEELLSTPEIGVLCTVDPEGRPEGSPIWFEARGTGTVYVHVDRGSKKARNLRQNPNLSLTIDTRQAPYRGAVLHGTAKELPYDEAIRRRVALRYLGPETGEAWLAMTADTVDGTVLLEISVSKRFTWDYGKGYA